MKYALGLGFACGLALLAGATLAGASSPVSAGQGAEPWPGFTMVYEERRPSSGSDGATLTYKLDYYGRENWRVELLSHTTWPEDAGSWTEHKNGIVSSYFAPFNWFTTGQAPKDGYHVVDEWLIPNRVDELVGHRGWSKAESGDPTVMKVVKTEQLPCSPEPNCTNGVRVVHETRTFRAAHKLPLSVRLEVDGEVKREIQVQELILRP